MHVGAMIDYVVSVNGIPMRWTTCIAEYAPPHRFVDVQLKGPYSFWHHTHTFEAQGEGTLIRDEVRYALPFGPFGEIAHAVMVKRQLNTIFNFRRSEGSLGRRYRYQVAFRLLVQGFQLSRCFCWR